MSCGTTRALAPTSYCVTQHLPCAVCTSLLPYPAQSRPLALGDKLNGARKEPLAPLLTKELCANALLKPKRLSMWVRGGGYDVEPCRFASMDLYAWTRMVG